MAGAQATGMNRQSQSAATQGADADLDVLHPERVLQLGERRVCVREYGHVEWMRLLGRAAPLVAAIAALLEQGREPLYEQALQIVADHVDELMPLVAQAADMTPAEVAALAPDEGELLLMTWWGVNGRFFVLRALNRVAVERAQSAQSGSARSTPRSSRPATTPGTSAATPSGN